MKIKTEDLWGIAQTAGFKALKCVYLRPGIPSVYPGLYDRNYNPDGKRRVLLTEEALREVDIEGVPGDEYGVDHVLNYCLERFECPDRLKFFEVDKMDEELKEKDMDKVQEQLRGIGMKFMDSMDSVGSNIFFLAHEPSIDFVDLCLGARHGNYKRPKEGDVCYRYKKPRYPFREESPSERAVWSFVRGAMLPLHSSIESVKHHLRGEDYPPKPFKDVRYAILHHTDDVYVYGNEEDNLKKRFIHSQKVLERMI